MNFSFVKKIQTLSPKTYWKEMLAITMLLFAYLFFRGHRHELATVGPQLHQANPLWVAIGIAFTGAYIFFQSMMYVKSFTSIALPLKIMDAVELFLKRNFLSVFLPAGSISSLAYTTSQLRKKKLNTAKIHQAGGIYAFVGLLTIFVIAVPVVIYHAARFSNMQQAAIGLLVLFVLLFLPLYIMRSIKKRTFVYHFFRKKFPSFIVLIHKLSASKINRKQYAYAILHSLAVDACGIIHIYIAMMALGVAPSVAAAVVAYTISVLLMIVSPFLRGLGAVELSMLYIFGQYGYAPAQAMGIIILYRLFEFWLPLLLGLFSFAWRGKQLFIRLLPAFGIFILGLVNVLSVLTPPLRYRIRFVRHHLPIEAIHASKLMVLFVGLGLIGIAAYLIKGLRSAFYIAILFCALSLVGNMVKAWDYEESILAALIIILLLISHKEYRMKSNTKWVRVGLLSVITLFSLVCIMGIVGFYLINTKHFGINFTWQQSIYYSVKSFLLIQDASLQPVTRFGKEFLRIMHISGFIAWGFLAFTFIKAPVIRYEGNAKMKDRAQALLEQYGNSAVDYFKCYKDKLLFFSRTQDAFIGYRIALGFAVVLEDPVCSEACKIEVLDEFQEYCMEKGLKPVFYRVGENSLQWFELPGRQKILIGQEAILDVHQFTLSGKNKKSLRNGLNSLTKKGYVTELRTAPHATDFLQQLKAISDEWLNEFDREELVFSQGMFDEQELQQQDMIIVKDADSNVKAFLNIIPDYTPEECTYDLIRKTTDAPGGCMDALIVGLTEYAKTRHCQYINMGMVPLSGIEQPQSPAEKLIKYASEKLKRFRNYQSLRDFKEKYDPIWENKYLVYDNDFDLLQLPMVLNKLMKV